MKCAICGTPISYSTDRCPTCGCRCRTAWTTPTSADDRYNSHDTYTRPQKRSGKGCMSCGCLAALILPILFTLIVWGFIALSNTVSDMTIAIPEPLPAESAPYTESLPDVDSVDCFSISAEGAVTFRPDRWDGGPVLSVPDTVNGQAVTALDTGCFRDCTELTTIVLPDTITEIGPMAFSGCTKLRGMFLPESVESVGKEAFSDCISLEAIHVGSAVSYIAPGCFDDCASLIFIFYNGNFRDWNALYSGYITPRTIAICGDGDYHHGVPG